MVLPRAALAALCAALLLQPAARASGSGNVVLSAILAPSRQAGLRARVDGTLQTVFVRPGDMVKKDQLLGRVANARVDDDVRIAEARDLEGEATARSRRHTAMAALESARARRAELEASMARVQADRNLAARVIVGRDLRAAEATVAVRQKDVRAAERALDQATVQSVGRAARDRARALEELRAPFDGTVLAQSVAVGQKATLTGPVVFNVVQLDPMVMQAPAPSEAFRYVPQSGSAPVTVDEVSGAGFLGAIAGLDVVYSPPTGRLTVTVNVSNPKGLLRPGMHAHAAVPLAPSPQRPEVEGPEPSFAFRF